MEEYGERFARDLNGNTFYVPADTTYEQWKQMQDGKYGDRSVDKSRQITYNKSADLKQYEKYKKVLKENAPIDFAEFTRIKYNDILTWKNLKYQYRTVNRYEVDGDVPINKIIELDNVAYYTKKKGFDFSAFTGKAKQRIRNALVNGGNAASMEFDGKIFFSHSKFDVPGTLEYRLYNANYPAVALSDNRIFSVKDLGDGIPRQYDTEAKFLEFVAKQKNIDDQFSVTILSEKHICESCQGVVEQFKKMFPKATVNIVSGKRSYNKDPNGVHTWKRRKKVK